MKSTEESQFPRGFGQTCNVTVVNSKSGDILTWERKKYNRKQQRQQQRQSISFPYEFARGTA